MMGLFKVVGAGLCTMALCGAGIGIGLVFAGALTAIGRDRSARQAVMPVALLGFALCEATGLFGLMLAFIILFS